MRILGFSEKRDKLRESEFTTFRFRRRDRDWAVDEPAQVVYKPRSKNREILGEALILGKEPRWVLNAEDDEMKHYGDYFAVKVVTEAEAIADGFENKTDMVKWIGQAHQLRNLLELLNKLTVRWI